MAAVASFRPDEADRRQRKDDAMPTVPLPDDPSLEQLRKQAKDIRDLAKADVPGVLELIAAHHPKGAHPVTLAGAQLVVARHHGFSSWARLKNHLEIIERYRRVPDEIEDTTDVADEFLVLACLRYGGDDAPSRWERAAQLLADHPEITRSSIHVAAAAADEAAVRALLDGDATLARSEGGPYGWEPLLYLAYARHNPAMSEAATLSTARLLLDHGADPNAGYLWHGMPPPFTALTGALGNGEGDQPDHPHGFALASLLLDAGADANDGQALYNRQFRSDDRHLVLLLEKGLGRGAGGPWRARLGHTLDSPSELVRVQLWWAIVHDMRDRVRLLVEHGADFHSPFSAPGGRPSWARTSDGRTPVEVAALAGCPELVDWLVAKGATRPAAEGVDGLIAAAFAGDRATVHRLRARVDEARAERPALIVWAAARQKRDAIPLLVELGFDVNALGRSDIPMEQAWETALHEAAGSGDIELARLLLEFGADPNIKDARFDSTPLGWAHHFGQQALIELLEPLTT
jgi:ankyrin repeat protein